MLSDSFCSRLFYALQSHKSYHELGQSRGPFSSLEKLIVEQVREEASLPHGSLRREAGLDELPGGGIRAARGGREDKILHFQTNEKQAPFCASPFSGNVFQHP